MSKQVNPNQLNRRSDDPPDSNFTKVRMLEERLVVESTPMDSYTKWVVGIVGIGIISALSFLAARDRTGIDTDIGQLNSQLAVTSTLVINHETQIQVLKTRQDRVLEDLKVIQAAVNDNNAKLDKVLTEIRKLK